MTEIHSVTGAPVMSDDARYALRDEVVVVMAKIISEWRFRRSVGDSRIWAMGDHELAQAALNAVDMDELAALAGFEVVVEWRVLSVDGHDFTRGGRPSTETEAREWAAHCNGAGHTDRDPNTYMINQRPFHVESRTVLRSPFKPPHPLDDPYVGIPRLSGSALEQGRYEANAEAIDETYPGYRENLANTLAVLRERGPICDTCMASAIWSEGLGWCHLVRGVNVLPHQDPADHRPNMTTWNSL